MEETKFNQNRLDKIKKFKEQVTIVQRGKNYSDIIKDHVYFCQCYGSRLGKDTRDSNTEFKSIGRQGSAA